MRPDVKLCGAKSLVLRKRSAVRAEFRDAVYWLLRASLVLCCGMPLMGIAAAQRDKPAPQKDAAAALPPALATARERVSIEQPGAPAFHLVMEFESTSDTGAVSRGTITEDWWTGPWWRRVIVVNGKRREDVMMGDQRVRDEDDGFVLPLRLQTLMAAFRMPFPAGPQQVGGSSDVHLEGTTLHCTTLPAATEAADLKPAAKTYCVDDHDNLRMTTDPVYRVVYNRVRPVDASHQIAWNLLLLRGAEEVAVLRVQQFGSRSDGPAELQQMSMDDRVRFVTAKPRGLTRLPPAWMQRQFVSMDVRMVVSNGSLQHAGQRYAIVRVLEANGRLLDAEVLGASDDAARALAMKVLRVTTFRVPRQEGETVIEGTVLLVAP